MLVKDLLKDKQREVISVSGDTSIDAAMQRLLQDRISCLPVLDDSGSLIGIVSDKDIFKVAYENDKDFKQMKVGDIMTTDLIVGVVEDEIEYIAAIMTNNRIRHVPVMSEGKMVNLLSLGDIVKAQLRDLKVTNRYLRMYIEGSYPG